MLPKLGVEQSIPPIGPETVFEVAGFPIANSFLMIWLIVVLLCGLGWYISKRFDIRPSRFQSMIEVTYEAMLDLVNQITGSRERSKVIFPLAGALFIYIGVANFIGLVPGLTDITYNGVSVFRTPTADFNTTFGLALAMVLLTHVTSIADWGFLGHLGKFFQFGHVYRSFKKSISDGLVSLIDFCIGLLDIISEAAKVISLSIRLFGNMYAGQVLMVILVGAVAVILPSLWFAMSLLSALIQAIVFGALVTSYYALSVKTEETKEISN